MDYLYYIVPSVLLVFIIGLVIIFYFKKKAVIKKVNSLSASEKEHILNTLAAPIGYSYDSCHDIFSTRLDAPQKMFGYTALYDLSAAYFNMVFDYETIYFNYKSRTWLIEMWKGQYGINTGCELGVYYADRILEPNEYNHTLFNAVDSKDMLDISLKLNRYSAKDKRQYTKLAYMKERHWWLTIFRMGIFSKPDELFVNTSITFKDYKMMQSFLESFTNTLPDTFYKTGGLTVYFTFSQSTEKYSFFKKAVRSIALAFCKTYCKLFNHITRPFLSSGDKLLYLYYYLPFTTKHLFKSKTSK